jgi:hypothetical protein
VIPFDPLTNTRLSRGFSEKIDVENLINLFIKAEQSNAGPVDTVFPLKL